MYNFSKISKERLAGCHPDLQVLFNEVILYYDCSIIVGRRGMEDQNKAFNSGKSSLEYPLSKHNQLPLSLAIDVAPYPIDWEDKNRFYHFGGLVQGIAHILFDEARMKHRLRWGGDWDGDNDLRDQKLYDLVHFEIME